MGGGFERRMGRRLRERAFLPLSRAGRAVERRVRIGGGVRFLLGSAIDFLVEDSCALCRTPHAFRREPPGGMANPAGLLLEPVVLRFLGGVLAVRNHPLCRACVGELVAARATGVLGRRVGGFCIETEIGGTFGSPDGAPAEAAGGGSARAAGGEKADGTDGGSAGDGAARITEDTPSGGCLRILAPFMTTDQVLEIVHLLKFGGYTGLAGPMARAMAWGVRSLEEGFAVTPLLVPVPMDDKALRRRGFNPAERLARELSRDLGFPMAEILHKTTRTRPQSKTPSHQRAANVRNAFACAGDGALPGGEPVLLVDDLVTTGATAAACAAALLRAGAGSVTVVCFGRAM